MHPQSNDVLLDQWTGRALLIFCPGGALVGLPRRSVVPVSIASRAF